MTTYKTLNNCSTAVRAELREHVCNKTSHFRSRRPAACPIQLSVMRTSQHSTPAKRLSTRRQDRQTVRGWSKSKIIQNMYFKKIVGQTPSMPTTALPPVSAGLRLLQVRCDDTYLLSPHSIIARHQQSQTIRGLQRHRHQQRGEGEQKHLHGYLQRLQEGGGLCSAACLHLWLGRSGKSN